MNKPNDDKILRLFNQGDPEAFTSVYKSQSKIIFHFAKHILGSREEAEDIVAETFFKLVKAERTFESMEKIIGFLHVSVKNACIDYKRHKEMQESKRDKITEAFIKFHEPRGDPDPITDELQKQIGHEIDKLPKKFRDILKMSFLEEVKNSEIADHFNISEKTVRNKKTLALNKIRLKFSK
ncbi:MAG TPA: sigma-70 family RNA polymerase sigma factor [Nitrosopumilaceae archaeon]|jgi:RNA polymerase sigma-70 factor (family 1)|nr:sigma-70 family RNA polymerase sigma factor [Nitrosopumilaceae archaeon]